MTLDKQAALRDVLSERDMVKIRPIKTSFENSSFLRSLALNSSACKVSPSETHSAVKVSEKRNEKIASPTKLKSIVLSKPETDVKPKPEPEKTEAQEMSPLKTQDPPKGVILFGNKTPPQNQVTTGQTSSAKVEEKSPLASLSGIVSSIEKETDVKPKSTDFAFGFPSSFKLNNTETIKESFVFGSTEKQFQKKPEETKAPQTFTFGLSKPPDSIFGKTMETSNFNIKSSFNVVASETNTTTKQESPKTGIAVVPFSTATPATTFSPFTFTFTSPTFASSTGLPKVNVSFGKEQVLETATTTSATPQTTNASGNLLSTSFSQSSSTPLVGSSPFTFTSAKTTSSCDTPTSSTQLTSSVFSHPIEKKGVVVTEVSVIKSNLETETEEVDVLSVEDFEKPSVFTNSSVSLKATPNIISATSPIVSTVETTSTNTISSATAVQGVTTSQSSPDTSASTFTKPAVATSGETPSISASPVFDSTATSIATSSVLTFSTSSPLVFGQTTPASTNFFGQPPSTTSVTVSSTTPTPRGETTTTNIFGGTLTTKPVFGQASTASTSTSGTILSNSTSAIVTTSSDVVATAATGSSSVFTESVAQTTNIFGQLLSDSNRSENLFSTSSTTATSTPNIFSTPKNVFGGATTTTASAFGETNSIFLQNNSVFQQLGSPSNTFENTPNSMVFGEQNVCSPFGGSISATSNQSTFESGGFESKSIFGQSLFGSNTNNTFVFGGSSGLSIFGGSSSSSGNVFQPTTTTTFGCTTPGPFSSSQGSVAETGFGAANTFQKPLSKLF